MKGFTGAQFLSVAAALAALAEAKPVNKARMVENADMTAMPNMKMLQHGIELTQRGGGSKDVDVDVNLKATLTADISVAGTVAATVEQVCKGAHHQLCSPGYCADLYSDAENCGQCGFACPKYSTCSADEDPDYPCECPAQFHCQRGDECHKPVCGDRCMDCPKHSECNAEESMCECPYLMELCEPEGQLAYCANTGGWDLFGEDLNKRDLPWGGEVFNCGECGCTCPQADYHKNFGPARCYPNFPLIAGEKTAHCDCGDGYKRCEAGPHGGGVCAENDNDYLCGATCETSQNCAGDGKACQYYLGVYSCVTPS